MVAQDQDLGFAASGPVNMRPGVTVDQLGSSTEVLLDDVGDGLGRYGQCF